jgi:hypothetical protein
VGRFAELLRTRTTDWFFARLEGEAEAAEATGRHVEPEAAYLSVILRSMRVTHSRKGLSRFYAAVTSCCSLPRRGGAPAQFFVLTTPPSLRGIEPKHADRILTLNKRLLGPVPYRGGDLEVQVGLLSVKAAELAGPYLELLENMASVSGVSLVGPALAFAEPLQRGLDLLVGAADPVELEIGLSATFPTPETGVFCLIGTTKDAIDVSRLRVDGTFQLLIDEAAIVDHPYLVWSVEATPWRDDWTQIPAVRDQHEDLVREVESGDVNRVREALASFRRTAVTSADLLAADGARLADIVSEEVKLALGTIGQSRARPRLRPLAAVDLYRQPWPSA